MQHIVFEEANFCHATASKAWSSSTPHSNTESSAVVSWSLKADFDFKCTLEKWAMHEHYATLDITRLITALFCTQIYIYSSTDGHRIRCFARLLWMAISSSNAIMCFTQTVIYTRGAEEKRPYIRGKSPSQARCSLRSLAPALRGTRQSFS